MIDIEKPAELRTFLNHHRLIMEHESLGFKILHGGVSNRAILVERNSGPNWVFKQALNKLRVETDWFCSTARIHQEAKALRWLKQIIPDNVPSLVWEDKDNQILGMTEVPTPHTNWKTDLLNGTIDLEQVNTFARLLAKLHDATEQHPQLKEAFREYSYFESLRLDPYYAYTASQVPEASNFLDRLINETKSRKQALVHGDYSPKNVLIHNHQMFILDYEVMHIGDPAFDLGFSLTHFLSKAHAQPKYRNLFFQAALNYWDTYSKAIKEPRDQLEHMTIKHTLACMLARVCGRSQLEYLNQIQKDQQKQAVLSAMSTFPVTLKALIEKLQNTFKG
ncbi:MAG: aminoglycoside phosphotransferase [Cyclobacteriaceae bacterium]|nr:MAG: aminoglycoside phosphotransferase [Cyclobacteriaceae bacterium]